MKTIITVALLMFLVNCEPAVKQTASTELSSEKSLEQKLDEGAFLVDVRTPEEFAEGSVDGAINIPLDQVENRITEFKNKNNIVVFCRTGNRSGQAIDILEKNGINGATNGTNVETIQNIKAKK